MTSGGINYFLLAALVIAPVAMYFHARSVREQNPDDEYFKLNGRKLKYKSATFDGNNYAFVIEYIVSEEKLGIRCYFPPFSFTTKYEDIELSKSKALIGSLVRLETPKYQGKIEITHKLAKKLDKLSNGKVGYKNV